MNKRLISIIMLALVGILLLLLSSCSGKDKSSTKDEATKTIKFATFYSDKDQGGIYKDIAKEYEKNNKDIKVEVETDFGNEDKIKEAFGTKGDIDIIGIKRNQLIEYAKSGLLADITKVIDENELTKKLYKISLAYGNYNGKNYGIGDLPMSMEWFYNPDIFKRFNIKEPLNLQSLLTIAKKVNANKIIPIGLGAIDGFTINTLFGMITCQTTGVNELTSNYGSDMNAFKKIPNISTAFNIFSKLSGKAVLTNSDEVNYKQSVQDFVNGKTAILPAGSWAIELIDQTKPAGFNYKVFNENVLLTTNPKSLYSVSSGEVLTMPANSKNSKEAEKFLKFLFSDEVQKKFTEKGYVSALISANATENETKKLILKHIEAADNNSIMLMDNLEPTMLDSMTMVLKDELQGRVKPNEAWDRILKFTFQR
jgi:ABC-type glycerol-3-phosphate transport system substrate-binding protein